MPEQFDPYHQWLGIQPDEQPPTHYRLLGLTVFESNADVIANAADRQMSHVKSFQAGKNSALSQKLLNEIASAKICLLNSSKKLAYDELLRKKMKPSLLVVARPLEVNPVQEAIPDAFDFIPASPTLHKEQSPTSHKKSVKKNPQQLQLAVGAGVVAVLLLVGIVAVVMNRSNNTPEPKREVVAKPIDAPKPPPPPEPKRQPKPPEVQPEPKIDPEPKPLTQEPKVDPQPEPEPKPVDTKPEPPQVDPETPTKEKLPVPDDVAQQKSLATIRDIYKGEDRAALAKILIDKAKETQDATDRFVLLQEAKNVASEAFQGKPAFEAIDQMSAGYKVSGSDMKAEVLEKVVKKPRLTPENKIAIAEAVLPVIDEAVEENNFEVAKKLIAQASQLVRLSKDKDLLQEIVAKNKEVATAEKSYTKALEAMAILKEKPDDPDANMAVGKYLCFVKGDWDKGLPMLVLSSDEKLKALAMKDIAGADSTKEQVKLGDAWWDLGGKQRAAYWYEKALPGLAGLEKARAEKRVAGETVVHSKQTEIWISKEATYVVSSGSSLPSLLNESEQFEHFNQFAFHTDNQPDAHIVIDLGKSMSITRMYIQNRSQDAQERANGLTVWFSSTSDGRGQKTWTAPAVLPEWNIMLEKPTTARYVTIGLPENVTNCLHLRKVKIFGYEGGVGKRVKTAVDTPTAASRWVVIFRSANPKIWNTDFRNGKEIAVPVANVADNVKYLKMSYGKEYVVIPIKKENLLRPMTRECVDNEGIGWCGDNAFIFNAYHFGIYNRAWPGGQGSIQLDCTSNVGLRISGWGFGNVAFEDNRQGYCWAGKPIAPTVFEIAVKAGALTKDENKFLLVK